MTLNIIDTLHENTTIVLSVDFYLLLCWVSWCHYASCNFYLFAGW